MSNPLIDIIASSDPSVRDTALEDACRDLSLAKLLSCADELDAYWRACDNLYRRVRAQFFLYAIHRFHLPATGTLPSDGHIPHAGYRYLLKRRFEEAIDAFLGTQTSAGPSDAVSSALAAAYHALAFQTLANQVPEKRPFRAWKSVDVPDWTPGRPTPSDTEGDAQNRRA